MSYGYSGRSNPYDQRGPAPSNEYNAPRESHNNSHEGRYNSQPYEASQPYGISQPYSAPQQYGAPQPYETATPAYGSNTRYNGAQPAMGRDNYGANVEMEPLAPNGSSFGGRQHNPNAILNECREVDKGIDLIENNLESLKTLQAKSLNDPDSSLQSSSNRQLDDLSSEIMNSYREFTGRLKAIKQQPESGTPRNAPQVGKVDRRLKAAIQQYQRVDSEFRAGLRKQIARQYRIVNPNASDAEVETVVDTPSQQIFTQALMQSSRRENSAAALRAVEDRHAAIQKIESQMRELADLFNDMDVLVMQQEAAVVAIEQKGEEVVENISSGNEHLVKGVTSARARNKKKWWCLLICVIIIIIIVIVVIIYVKVINPPKTASSSPKRGIENAILARDVVAEGFAWIPRGRSILPSASLVANTLE